MRILSSLLIIAALAGQVSAQTSDEAGVRAVIEDQFADFRAGDLAGAFEHASPTLQMLFVSPDNFGRMVKTGYPDIWAARSVDYLGLRDEGGRTIERVRVTGPDGATKLYDYVMQKVGESWRIDGVFPVAEDELSA